MRLHVTNMAAVSLAAVILSHPCTHGFRAVAAEDNALIGELLRRTEANKEANAAQVRRITEQNAYTAVSGDIKKLVTAEDGSNVLLSDAEVFELTRQGRLLCGVGSPCCGIASVRASQSY